MPSCFEKNEKIKMGTVFCKIVTLFTPLSEDNTPKKDEQSSVKSEVLAAFCIENNTFSFSYSEENEGVTTKTELCVLPDSVRIRRTGGVLSDILLRADRTEESVYSVPPFSFPLAVRLLSRTDELTEAGGRLRLLYEMTLGGEKSRVSFCLTASHATEDSVCS